MFRATSHAKSVPYCARHFGHTCRTKLLDPVYYTASERFDDALRAITCFRLPTIGHESFQERAGRAHGWAMTKQTLTRIVALLPLLAVLLALSPHPPADLPARLVPGFSAPWHWPLAGDVRVFREFEGPAQNWLPGHRGVDLVATPGFSVLAPQEGVVSFRGVVVDRPVLVIDHGHGFKSSFEPVTSELSVGDWVSARDIIGELSTGAHCLNQCLHWGVRLNGDYIDPALLIEDLRPSVLLPLG